MHMLAEPGFDTVAGPFISYGHRRWHAQQAVLEAKRVAAEGRLPGEPEPEASPLAPLRARIQATVSDAGLRGRYEYALDELEMALAVRQDPDDAHRDVLDAMVWLWMVSESLVPLLRVPTQEAVAIFAHYSVLLKHHESRWWLQGWAEHVVMRAQEILDEEHREWIEWPVRELELMSRGGVAGAEAGGR
jgi:hypothetical protein